MDNKNMEIKTIIQSNIYGPDFERLVEQIIVSSKKSQIVLSNRLPLMQRKRLQILDNESMYQKFWKILMTNWWWFGLGLLMKKDIFAWK